MTASPWIRFFPSDWLAGTRGMSAAETGIYITLVSMMYERGAPIVEDNARLARLCGTSASAFKRAVDALVGEGKLVREDAGLWNRRVARELDHVQKMSAAGRANAEVRWQNPKSKSKVGVGKSGGQLALPVDEQHEKTPNDFNEGAMPAHAGGICEPPCEPPCQTHGIQNQNQNPPNPLKGETSPKGFSGETRIGDFEPDLMAAIAMGLSPDRTAHEAAKFRDHWLAAPGKAGVRADWPAAWRKWVRDAIDWQASRARSASTGPPANGRTETDEELLARRKRERDEREAREARP